MIESKAKTDINLKDFSTFKIGGKAPFLFYVTNNQDIHEVLEFSRHQSLPVFFLGGGSNILFPDLGMSAVFIKSGDTSISAGIKDGEGIEVTVGAGVLWEEFVSWAVKNNFSGVENLAGIPGTVGASPVQNIGAYGVDVSSVIRRVVCFDTKTNTETILSKDECEFGYRMSLFKTNKGKHLFITKVVFQLSLNFKPNLEYKDLQTYWQDKTPSLVEVASSVRYIRSKKFPDLALYGTAGSFFKNVVCDKNDITDVLKDFPSLPVFDVGHNKVKVSTAFLIDKVCGLKGLREGDVGLFPNQSLVVVNFGSTSSHDIKQFVNKIKKIVFEKTKINIKEEVIII